MEGLDPSLYTKEYFLSDCSGFDIFKKTFGKKLEPRQKYLLSHINPKRGMKVLDIGCGRGEVLFWAARKGAQAIGIDYSKEAIKLARIALKKQPKKVQDKVILRLQNAKKLDFEPNSFDGIFLVDILEHLYPDEQKIVLSNCFRVLKRGGFILAHTEPNKLYLNLTFPYWCYPVSTLIISVWNRLFIKDHPNLSSPSLMRSESHKVMHINEPTFFSLRQSFTKAGFKTKTITRNTKLREVIGWKDQLYNFFVFLDPISRKFPLSALFANDFIIHAKK